MVPGARRLADFAAKGHDKPIGFNTIAECFLGSCLGGRVEPVGETVRQSTAQIVHGAEVLRASFP